MSDEIRLTAVRRALELHRKRVKGPALTHEMAKLRSEIDRAIEKDETRLRWEARHAAEKGTKT